MPAPAHNKRVVAWQKTSKTKAKVAKKRAGTAVKHKQAAVNLVSGARTGKGKKKAARKQKLAEKERAALEMAMEDVEMQDTKGAKKAAKQQKQQQQGGAAAEAGDTMQE